MFFQNISPGLSFIKQNCTLNSLSVVFENLKKSFTSPFFCKDTTVIHTQCLVYMEHPIQICYIGWLAGWSAG